MTENQILVRDAALAALPSDYDTGDGSVFWTIVSALAIPCGAILDAIDEAIAEKDPANLEGDDLDLFVAKYGMVRHLGTAAEASLTVTLDDTVTAADIPGGTLFETEDGLQFAADEDFTGVQDGGTITVTSVDNGEIYNVGAGEITVVPIAIEGVESVTNPTAATGGVDAETDGDLFERWQIQVGYIQTGYNKAWYEAKALDIDPVGYARAYAAGEEIGNSAAVPANYVYVVVLDDANEPLTEDALAAVQLALDPDAAGIGEGIAPPTAHCQAINGTVKNVSIAIENLTIDSDYAAQGVKNGVEDMMQQAMGSAAPGDVIYYAQIISSLMAVDGVKNVSGVTINGAADSLGLAYNQVAALSEVTYGSITAV